MIKTNNNKDDFNFKKDASLKLKDFSPTNNEDIKINNDLNLNINNNNIQNKQTYPNNIKNSKSCKNLDIKVNTLEINSKINKVKTFNKEKRIDRFGNMIIHGGKQKVSFIDKVSKTNFIEEVKVENFKKFNKMEEPSTNLGNGCCLLF